MSQKQLKRMFNKVGQSRQTMEELITKSPYAILVCQLNEVVFVNPLVLDLLNCESEMELIGRSISEVITWERSSELLAQMEVLLAGKLEKGNPIEMSFINKENARVHVEVLSNLITFEGADAFQIVISDVTTRKNREEVAKRALEEKKVLIQEIHHRVKNNLAIISGLMELQALSFDDEKMVNAFYESIGRIKSIALVHEEMYESQNLNKIRFYKDIETLVEHVATQNRQCSIDCSFTLEEIELNVNQAVPCALFLNEAVTNVFKHAYANGEGPCRIDFFTIGDDIVLRIQDEGDIENAKNVLENRKNLGFSLMEMMGAQLMGKFELESATKGVSVSLTFQRGDHIKGSAANTKIL